VKLRRNMTDSINIEGYKALVKDSTWGRKIEPIQYLDNDEAYPTTQILQIVRFTTPSESQVLKLIYSCAGYVLSRKDMKDMPGSVSEMSKFLKNFPTKEVEKLAEWDREMFWHLKKHYSQGNWQPKRTYVQCKTAAIPNKVIKKYKKDIDREAESVYEGLMHHSDKKKWSINFMLDGKGNLPAIEELESLLKKGVKECYCFNTDVNYKEYSDMAEQLRAVYKPLSPKGELDKIQDFSDQILSMNAINTIKNTSRCGSRIRPIGGIIGIIDGPPRILSPEGYTHEGFSQMSEAGYYKDDSEEEEESEDEEDDEDEGTDYDPLEDLGEK
jgi:hypothetical protein